MALLHRASTLTPTKLDLASAWAVEQPWFSGDPQAVFEPVGSYRFDDPEGQVGIETLLIRAGEHEPVLQIPVTYRDAPLVGAEHALIGTAEHSALGTRWVYDGVADPAYLSAVATVTLTGGHQADQFVEIEGELVAREPTAIVSGSGTDGMPPVAVPPVASVALTQTVNSTVVVAEGVRLVLARVLDLAGPIAGDLRSVATENGALVADSLEDSDATGAASAVLSGIWLEHREPKALALVFRG
jgi:Maltokinase N-terminal cap domain